MSLRHRSLLPLLLAAPLALAAEGDAPVATPAGPPPSVHLPTVEVLGQSEQALEAIPGSAATVDAQTLEKTHAVSTNEVLRKVPGVVVLDEEGLGLRPNIGLRGLDPNRSRKVLLLEDGVPLSMAPYGDNASYYHPPIERFERVEVLKGGAQLLYGPSSIGGVINYLTPMPSSLPSARLTVSAGNRAYLNVTGQASGVTGENGLVATFMHKRGQGARDNTFSELTDVALKALVGLGERQALTLKASYYQEDSQLTYSGLTQAEYDANPRQNPFSNDRFYGRRLGLSGQHEFNLTDALTLRTTAYLGVFKRDWWRQSSNSGQRPNDASDPACSGMANLQTTCGNQGRLREYTMGGVEPRLQWKYALLGGESQLDVGLRGHFEIQERRQENGAFPKARSGEVVENNQRRTNAWSAFVQNRFALGRFTVTPGARVEAMWLSRWNRLAAGGAGVSGNDTLFAAMPGLGATAQLGAQTTLFAGVHRGFAPPRPEDVIGNESGTVVELAPELSWNYELGVRSQPWTGVQLEATGFFMDFENQVVPASVAGGEGATLTNGGRTRHAGLEFAPRVDVGRLRKSDHNPYAVMAFTWLPVAEFVGTRTTNITAAAGSSVSGNRLPYAARETLTATAGYSHASGFDAHVEVVAVGDMFTDDLNTVDATPNGQRGLMSGWVIYNAAVSYTLPKLPGLDRLTVFASGKNLGNRTYIVDRSRGVLPGPPLTVQGGITAGF
ncbi:MAG: hypothetical protein RL653_3176 [Pseudomonadota bacterium]|jgi:Fe(3+) dicitrate transport protein